MSSLIRIYCDGNNGIDETRFDLACPGSMADIERHGHEGMLSKGQRVLFYETDQWEAEGTIHFDEERKRWFGIPDFATLRHLGPAIHDEERPNQSSQPTPGS